jgi:hypothetical protein
MESRLPSPGFPEKWESNPQNQTIDWFGSQHPKKIFKKKQKNQLSPLEVKNHLELPHGATL